MGCVPSQATRPATGATAGATLIPMVMNAQTTAATAENIWLREERVISISLFGRRDQATRLATGATAGATLMPTVMNAQKTAANTDAIWLREVRVISKFLYLTTGPFRL